MDAHRERENKRLNDPAIWRTLSHGGSVKRHYLYTGNGCNFAIELTEENDSVPGYYGCRALCAHNCLYAPDWVRLADLTPL